MAFFGKVKYNCNVCDHAASEAIIHFTKVCDNKCPFCIDRTNNGVSTRTPHVEAITETLIPRAQFISEVTISGGEPFLFMDSLIQLIKNIRSLAPHLKIDIMTACPKTCHDRFDDFNWVIDNVDYIGLTPQHSNELIAEKIRGHRSGYDRQSFYRNIPHKEKFGINLNCWKGYLDTKEDILTAVKHYNDMGFENIRICEMFDKDDLFVSIEEVLGIKMNSAFASGCSTPYDITRMIPSFKGTFKIKRVCFFKCNKCKASVFDWIKMLTRWVVSKKYYFAVIHEDGTLAPYWI